MDKVPYQFPSGKAVQNDGDVTGYQKYKTSHESDQYQSEDEPGTNTDNHDDKGVLKPLRRWCYTGHMQQQLSAQHCHFMSSLFEAKS